MKARWFAWAAGLVSLAAQAGPRVELGLPAPGTYQLDRIMQAPHGAVLDSEGRARRLAHYSTGRVTLFSFVYTACTDARGCPLALAVMHTLKAAIEADPALRGQVRFVSISIDPRHDTPAVMRSYGGAAGRVGEALPWHFLTTQSPRQLAPLLAGFSQDAAPDLTAAGLPALSHQLKLYLIDRSGAVREIYSPAFLQPATILGDMRTLALESRPRWSFQASR